MQLVSQRQSPVLSAERRAAIAELVAREGAVRSVDLATRFAVDVATIRRDLQALEERGDVQRVYGGAVAVGSVAASSRRSAKSCEARIGQAAARLVAEGEAVFLGAGRLTAEVARSLAKRPRLTIVTNGLEVASLAAAVGVHAVVVTGGQVEGPDGALVGPIARMALAGLHADVVILEVGGVSAVGGLTDDSLSRAEVARALMEIGSRVVVLAPAEKVGRVAAAFIAPASDADVVVTVHEAPQALLWDLSECGVRVVLA